MTAVCDEGEIAALTAMFKGNSTAATAFCDKLTARVTGIEEGVNTFFLTIMGALVFIMHAGFAMVSYSSCYDSVCPVHLVQFSWLTVCQLSTTGPAHVHMAPHVMPMLARQAPLQCFCMLSSGTELLESIEALNKFLHGMLHIMIACTPYLRMVPAHCAH